LPFRKDAKNALFVRFLGSLGEKMTMLHNGTFHSILHPSSILYWTHLQPHVTQLSYTEKSGNQFLNQIGIKTSHFSPLLTDLDPRLIQKLVSKGAVLNPSISHARLAIYSGLLSLMCWRYEMLLYIWGSL